MKPMIKKISIKKTGRKPGTVNGDTLTALRLYAGQTQQEAAEFLGVSLGVFSHWEQNVHKMHSVFLECYLLKLFNRRSKKREVAYQKFLDGIMKRQPNWRDNRR